MMKEYISLFLEKTKIPQYLSKMLLEQYEKISAHEDQVKELSEFETRFWNCHSCLLYTSQVPAVWALRGLKRALLLLHRWPQKLLQRQQWIMA